MDFSEDGAEEGLLDDCSCFKRPGGYSWDVMVRTKLVSRGVSEMKDTSDRAGGRVVDISF